MLSRNFTRKLASVAPAAPSNSYRVVVLGGGSAGIAVASQISKSPLFKGKKDILIVDPKADHYYQPLWTLVGAGLKSLKESGRPMGTVIPAEASWFQQSVKKIDPKLNSITTADRRTITYGNFVLI
jgi:NADH dehydrogenase FAD-containing subunit